MSDPFKAIDSSANPADKIKKYEALVTTNITKKAIAEVKKLIDHSSLSTALIVYSFGRVDSNNCEQACVLLFIQSTT
jgi:hypothetical protein